MLIVGVDEPISQSPAGVAYVETKSLDGETNLKIRQVHGYAREEKKRTLTLRHLAVGVDLARNTLWRENNLENGHSACRVWRLSSASLVF